VESAEAHLTGGADGMHVIAEPRAQRGEAGSLSERLRDRGETAANTARARREVRFDHREVSWVGQLAQACISVNEVHRHTDSLQKARLIGRHIVGIQSGTNFADHLIKVLTSEALRRLHRRNTLARQGSCTHASRPFSVHAGDAIAQWKCGCGCVTSTCGEESIEKLAGETGSRCVVNRDDRRALARSVTQRGETCENGCGARVATRKDLRHV
jgi:hypothetical protein